MRKLLVALFALTLASACFSLSGGDDKKAGNDSEDGGSSSSHSGGNSDDDAYWRPYQFKGTETFEYDISQTKGEKTEEGHYTVKMSKAGEKYKVEVEGELGENGGSFSTTVKEPDDLTGVMIAQTFMNPWAAPLVVTMFTPAMMGMFTFGAMGASWEVGSKWSRTQNGEKVTMEIPETCKYAGQKGRLFRMTKNDEVVYESCVSKDVALPLYVKTTDKGSHFEFTLTKYAE